MPELKDAPASVKTKENGAAKTPVQTPQPAVQEPWSTSPFAYLRRFAREMDRVFEDFGLERSFHTPAILGRTRDLLRHETALLNADWAPQIDVLEKDGHLIVHADLPGVSKDDIKVEVKDDMVTIQGETKHKKEEKREGYYCSERSQGTFFRAIPLPEGVETAKAVASFRNGVLEVSIPSPKLAKSQARRLEIKE